MMSVFSLLTTLLVAVTAIRPLRMARPWKIALTAAALAVSFKFQLLYLFGGPMFFAPDLPCPILLSAAWIYILYFLFFQFLLISVLVRAVPFAIRRLRHLPPPSEEVCARHRTRVNRVNLVLLTMAMVLATIGMIEGSAMPEVKQVTLELPGLPPEADGLRVVFVADLHIDSLMRSERLQAITDRVNALHPDVILLGGDLVDRRAAEAVVPDLQPLKELSARYGVYGVPGNHEYYSGYDDWMKRFESLGIRMLSNESTVLPVKTALAGITDPAWEHTKTGIKPDLEAALRGVPAGMPVILLAHRPKQAKETAKHPEILLQLSGHTHGGMIRGVDLAVAAVNGGFVSGLYRVKDLILYVSNGTGIWSGFPVRLGRPAEITLLNLVRDQQNNPPTR